MFSFLSFSPAVFVPPVSSSPPPSAHFTWDKQPSLCLDTDRTPVSNALSSFMCWFLKSAIIHQVPVFTWKKVCFTFLFIFCAVCITLNFIDASQRKQIITALICIIAVCAIQRIEYSNLKNIKTGRRMGGDSFLPSYGSKLSQLHKIWENFHSPSFWKWVMNWSFFF